jgi:hypothetical protein
MRVGNTRTTEIELEAVVGALDDITTAFAQVQWGKTMRADITQCARRALGIANDQHVLPEQPAMKHAALGNFVAPGRGVPRIAQK